MIAAKAVIELLELVGVDRIDLLEVAGSNGADAGAAALVSVGDAAVGGGLRHKGQLGLKVGQQGPAGGVELEGAGGGLAQNVGEGVTRHNAHGCGCGHGCSSGVKLVGATSCGAAQPDYLRWTQSVQSSFTVAH